MTSTEPGRAHTCGTLIGGGSTIGGNVATCSHIDTIIDVSPSGAGCVECLATGGHWVHLRMCQACGHVGCCDNSPGRHATAHFGSSAHPLIRSFEPGEEWFWCYIDDEAFELDVAPGPSHP